MLAALVRQVQLPETNLKQNLEVHRLYLRRYTPNEGMPNEAKQATAQGNPLF